jgi:site-specific recombinase XerC
VCEFQTNSILNSKNTSVHPVHLNHSVSASEVRDVKTELRSLIEDLHISSFFISIFYSMLSWQHIEMYMLMRLKRKKYPAIVIMSKIIYAKWSAWEAV